MAISMDDLVAAFAAASVTMSGTGDNKAAPSTMHAGVPHPPSNKAPMTEDGRTMDELVAAFAAASVSLAVASPPLHAAPASTTTMTTEDHDREPGKGEEACVLRVRFPDGRVLCRSFGAGRPVAALFRYCRSVLLAAGGGGCRRAFRVVKPAGGASHEVSVGSSSFRDLGLHRCTVHVVLV